MRFGPSTALALLFITAVEGHALSAPIDTATLALNPIAYFPFTPASQADSVVNGYTGVLVNGAQIGGANTGPGSDPSSSALILPNGATGTAYATAGGSNPLLGGVANTGTILAWIKLSSLPSTQGRIFSIAGESQFGNDLDFQINTDNLISFYTDGGSRTTNAAPLSTSDLDTYIFVAATFTGSVDRNIYVDGVLSGSSVPGDHASNNAPFYEGQSSVFGGRYFDGSISDVALFDRELTPAEIAGVDAAGLVSAPPTVVPEPASMALLGLGVLGLLTGRRYMAL